jgi:predicted Zn finger-like uncharacterized protein
MFTCPKCKAGYRRIELMTGPGTRGEFRCLTCNHVLEVFDGSTEVALRHARLARPGADSDGGNAAEPPQLWLPFSSAPLCPPSAPGWSQTSRPHLTPDHRPPHGQRLAAPAARVLSPIPRQLALSPMRVLSRRIKHPLDVTVQRLHDADPREHRWAAVAFGDQDQSLNGCLPFLNLLFCLRQFLDVSGSVLQRDELATLGQGDRFLEWPVPALGCVTRRDQRPPA